ncbi:hypothetical protein ES703_87636 [subsurface metagenome]
MPNGNNQIPLAVAPPTRLEMALARTADEARERREPFFGGIRIAEAGEAARRAFPFSQKQAEARVRAGLLIPAVVGSKIAEVTAKAAQVSALAGATTAEVKAAAAAGKISSSTLAGLMRAKNVAEARRKARETAVTGEVVIIFSITVAPPPPDPLASEMTIVTDPIRFREFLRMLDQVKRVYTAAGRLPLPTPLLRLMDSVATRGAVSSSQVGALMAETSLAGKAGVLSSEIVAHKLDILRGIRDALEQRVVHGMQVQPTLSPADAERLRQENLRRQMIGPQFPAEASSLMGKLIPLPPGIKMAPRAGADLGR